MCICQFQWQHLCWIIILIYSKTELHLLSSTVVVRKEKTFENQENNCFNKEAKRLNPWDDIISQDCFCDQEEFEVFKVHKTN